MKLITLLVALALAVIASAESNEEHKAKYLENVRICRGESGYSEEALMKLKSGNVADNSSEAKAFAECVFKQSGSLDEAGNLLPDVATERLTMFLGDKSKAEEVVKDCQNAEAADKDAVPLAIYKCISQHRLMKQE